MLQVQNNYNFLIGQNDSDIQLERKLQKNIGNIDIRVGNKKMPKNEGDNGNGPEEIFIKPAPLSKSIPGRNRRLANESST